MVAGVGDLSTGHGTYPPSQAVTGSPTVTVNGKGIVRVGDAYAPHCNTIPPYDCHSGVVVSGSTSVTANGIPIALPGSPISCGDTVGPGSPNVTSG